MLWLLVVISGLLVAMSGPSVAISGYFVAIRVALLLFIKAFIEAGRLYPERRPPVAGPQQLLYPERRPPEAGPRQLSCRNP